MEAASFLIFGLMFAWFAGTGKLRALVDVLRTDPTQPAIASPLPSLPLVGPTGAIGTSAVQMAQSQLGKGYLYGAKTDKTLATLVYDCSSLVQSIYGALGHSLPRTSQDQSRAVTAVSNPVPGDLVFGSFSTANDHVGIYVGNGMAISALDENHGVISTAIKNWPSVHFGRVA